MTSVFGMRAGCIAAVAALVGGLALIGCAPDHPSGHLTSIDILGETCHPIGCGTPHLDPVTIVVDGDGKCSFDIVLGNGRAYPLEVVDYDFSAGPRKFKTDFADGWPGPKTVRARATGTCAGSVSRVHHVFTDAGSTAEDVKIGWTMPSPNTPSRYEFDVPVPWGSVPLRPATRVRITSPSTPVMTFCGAGCPFDVNGKVGTPAGASYPFPGLIQYSLVLRVGAQVEQGRSSTGFTVNGGGALFVALNTDDPAVVHGGWEIDIFVDESVAP